MSDLTPTRKHVLFNATVTHVGFLCFMGTFSIDIMILIKNKFYILFPNPSTKPNHHRKHSAFLHSQKISFWNICKLKKNKKQQKTKTHTHKKSPIVEKLLVLLFLCGHLVSTT